MKENKILEILYEWNPWKNKIDSGVPRLKYLKKLKKLSKTGQIVTITGPRRSGKSTLIKQFINSLSKKETKKILYINFEESRFLNLNLEFLHKIYETYKININPKNKTYLFLDEVQKISGWEKFVRSIHEKGDYETIIITASVSNFISKEYGTLLTGRHINMTVYPLDLKEFLNFKGILTGEKNELIFKKNEILNETKEYLKWGGFPKIVLSNEKKIILETYFLDLINRDIISRYKIKEFDKLNELAIYYLSNTANLHVFNRISKFMKVSHDTIERFSSYFQETYLFLFVKMFAFSLKQQSVNPKKVYCIDNGLIEAKGFLFMKDVDKRLENAVFLHLLFNGITPYYQKNGYEIDFYYKNTAVQVCYELNGATEREVNALNKIKAKNKYIITWNEEKKINGINVIPFYKWAINL